MSDILKGVREFVASAKSRLDFKPAMEMSIELGEMVTQDGTLLDMQKKSAVAALNAATDVLKSRYDSPSALSEALLTVRDVARVLEEPTLGFLAQWFFHIAYSGLNVTTSDIEVAKVLVARRQPNPQDNERELRLNLDRYEWLSAHGPNPHLTSNNARGTIVSSIVLPLPSGSGELLTERANSILSLSAERIELPAETLIRQSLSHCSKLLEEAQAAHALDAHHFLAQTPTFCVRISLTSIEERLENDTTLCELGEEISEHVARLRGVLDAVGYRSSSAVFSRYKQELELIREEILRSIDFATLENKLNDVHFRLAEARRGQSGLDKLSKFHADQASILVSGLLEDFRAKRSSEEELRQRLTEIEKEVERLEASVAVLTTSLIKRIQAAVRRDAPLVVWVNGFPNRQVAAEESERLQNIRDRLRALWDRAVSEEPQREEAFRKECDELTSTINLSDELPSVLSELLDLGRSLSEYSTPAQGRLRDKINVAFVAFRERARQTALLKAHFEKIVASIDGHHRKIRGEIDFDELNRRVVAGKRWALLKDFPAASRQECLGVAKHCFSELRRLRARQERAVAEREARAAELFEDLRTDIANAVADATTHSGRQSCWDELVSLDRRLRESARRLSTQQLDALRAALDEGFQKVRQARSAFAAGSATKFAYYNDVLGDIIARLEETPTRDTAFGAIDQLKPLRMTLRDERELLRNHRSEIIGLLDQASQAVDEIFERENSESKTNAAHLSMELERLEQKIDAACTWETAFALIALHKRSSATVRDTRLSIADRKELRLALERMWERIAEKLQQFRLGRATETVDSVVQRLEQQGWLLIVSDVPRAA